MIMLDSKFFPRKAYAVRFEDRACDKCGSETQSWSFLLRGMESEVILVGVAYQKCCYVCAKCKSTSAGFRLKVRES